MEHLLSEFRAYLLAIANSELDSVVRRKTAASDVVQETLLDAKRDLPGFRGTTKGELLRWLRKMLRNNIIDADRHAYAEKRHVLREQVLDSDCANDRRLQTDTDTPSELLSEQEEEFRLLQAMGRLPDEFRRVIEMRNWQLLNFARIGEELNRSEDAARKLWVRAIDRLRQELREH